MSILLKDHEQLHHSVLRATLAGGAAGVAALFLPLPYAVALGALAVGAAAVVPKSRSSAALAVFLACVAGAAMKWTGLFGVPLGALAVGVSLARDLEGGWRRVGTAALGAMGAAAGLLVVRAFGTSGLLGFLPSGLEALVAGAAGGFVTGVATLGRHLEPAETPREAELRGLAGDPAAADEIGQLLHRAAESYRETILALGEAEPAARQALDDLVVRMTRFGRRWREVEAQAARSKPEALRERLQALELRLESAKDAIARQEFEKARDAVAAQLTYLEEIEIGKERAVARLTHQVATLERVRLAAVRHRSADAARLGAELAPLVQEIGEAGGDLDVAAEALDEAAAAGALPPVRA